jgi:hypothetical protein
MSNVFKIVPMMVLLAATAAAGQKPAEQPPKTAGEKEAAAKLINEAAATAARVAAEGAVPVNVRVELTITDQRGDGPPVIKTVSMLASDRSWSRIRTGGDIRTNIGTFPVILNVDARPWLLAKESNRARVELTIEYRPALNTLPGTAPMPDSDKTTPNINESLSVILEDGKSMLISQSADPVTDRKVKVEVKTTILK